MNVMLRRATLEDAAKLAELMNLAGEGIPAYLWKQMAEPGEDIMSFGARRVAREAGGFSYTNAHVAVCDDAIAGMILSYKLPDPYDSGSIEELPPVVRPLVELESQVPGTWYVNAVAADAQFIGQGVGRKLMEFAEQLAREAKTEIMSLIVAEENAPAMKLYQKLNYQVTARRRIVEYPESCHTGDWILMKKDLNKRV